VGWKLARRQSTRVGRRRRVEEEVGGGRGGSFERETHLSRGQHFRRVPQVDAAFGLQAVAVAKPDDGAVLVEHDELLPPRLAEEAL